MKNDSVGLLRDFLLLHKLEIQCLNVYEDTTRLLHM